VPVSPKLWQSWASESRRERWQTLQRRRSYLDFDTCLSLAVSKCSNHAAWEPHLTAGSGWDPSRSNTHLHRDHYRRLQCDALMTWKIPYPPPMQFGRDVLPRDGNTAIFQLEGTSRCPPRLTNAIFQMRQLWIFAGYCLKHLKIWSGSASLLIQ
jgi:hypothetical protein